MLQSLVVLMAFQFAGDAVVRATGLPLPGPVLGMLLLAACLRGGLRLPSQLPPTAAGLIDHLGLLFVPAGVSIVTLGALVARDGVAMFAAIVVSTAAAVAVTGLLFVRRQPRPWPLRSQPQPQPQPAGSVP